MKKQLVTFLSAALLGLAAHAAQAAVVISNLDPGNADFGFNNQQTGQAVLISNRPIALSSVQFVQIGGFTTGETMSVYSRNADGTLGSSLFNSFTLAYDSAMTLTTATISAAFTLQANTGYFFVLTSPTTANVEWSYTSSTDYAAAFGVTLPTTNSSFGGNATSRIYYSLASGPQEFQVNGTALPAVPEPSTYALAGLALAGGVFAVARRRALAI